MLQFMYSFLRPIVLMMSFVFLCLLKTSAQSISDDLNQGWRELLKDNDTTALTLFQKANERATQEKNVEMRALSFLYLGMASYGSSYNNGLNYAMQAIDEYAKLNQSSPIKSSIGRSRCLQLISTIRSRQGKFRESLELSREALIGYEEGKDSTGTLSLIYNSLGNALAQLNQKDSSIFYYRKALDEVIRTKNYAYLPNAYCKNAAVELQNGHVQESFNLYKRAVQIADSTNNRQALVSSYLGLGEWYVYNNDLSNATNLYTKAQEVAKTLSDQSFYLQSLSNLCNLKKRQGNIQEALLLQEDINKVVTRLDDWEKQRMLKSLEVQFDVREKERKIKLIQKDNELSKLTNLFLGSTLLLLIGIATIILWLQRRVNKQDKLLLKAQQELALAQEEQKQLNERQLQNEIEFKESQLTAMTLQMLQKNELMQDMKEKYDQESNHLKDGGLGKLIHKALNQEKDWADFDTHFESMNKNFYQRLKQSFPDISPNEMKICALIKLNLSIKEMAGILNISPDSVKTARYRLRKKLELNTEDNLTDFILGL